MVNWSLSKVCISIVKHLADLVTFKRTFVNFEKNFVGFTTNLRISINCHVRSDTNQLIGIVSPESPKEEYITE